MPHRHSQNFTLKYGTAHSGTATFEGLEFKRIEPCDENSVTILIKDPSIPMEETQMQFDFHQNRSRHLLIGTRHFLFTLLRIVPEFEDGHVLMRYEFEVSRDHGMGKRK